MTGSVELLLANLLDDDGDDLDDGDDVDDSDDVIIVIVTNIRVSATYCCSKSFTCINLS